MTALVLTLALGSTAATQSASTRKRTVEFYLPLAFGARMAVIQGQNQAPTHNDRYNRYAIDFAMPIGTPVHAAADGEVVFVKEDATGPTGKVSDNNRIVLRHADRTATAYLHLKKDGAIVQVGQRVRAGDQIGWSGNTGKSGSPHLHFVVISSYPGLGLSIPFKFVEVKKAGIPKTGDQPVSANFPTREITAELEWLHKAYELCQRLDQRGALAKLLAPRLRKPSPPPKLLRRIREATKLGRKGLLDLYTRYHNALQSACTSDRDAALAALQKARGAKDREAAARLAGLGELDYAWLDAKQFRKAFRKLARDKAIATKVRAPIATARKQRSALGRALERAFRTRGLTGKRREAAQKKARKAFQAISTSLGDTRQRAALAGWVAENLPKQK